MAQSASNSCEICMTGRGHNYCEQCEQWICENCKILHLRSKICRNHTFLSGENINPEKKLLCTEHDDFFLFYCLECEMPICKMCIVKKHKKHDTSEINESTLELQAKIQKVIESKIKVFKSNLDQIEQGMKGYQTDFQNLIRAIKENAKQMKDMIDDDVECLVLELNCKDKTIDLSLKHIRTGIQHDIEKLKKCQNVFIDSTKITDVTKRLQQLKHIESDLDNTKEKQVPEMPTVKYTKKERSSTHFSIEYPSFGDIIYRRKSTEQKIKTEKIDTTKNTRLRREQSNERMYTYLYACSDCRTEIVTENSFPSDMGDSYGDCPTCGKPTYFYEYLVEK